MKFSTAAIHVGQEADKTTGAIIPPLYLTSTYVQESPGNHKGYEYTRSDNPNFTHVESTLAALEEGDYGHIFSSGLGAISTLIHSLVSPGQTIIAINDLYGGSVRLMRNVFGPYGINLVLLDVDDLSHVDTIIDSHDVALLRLETPTNPLLKIADITGLTAHASKHGILTVVDNTFATPYFQKPLTLGADIVLHSATKYLGGHSDLIAGVTVTKSKEIKQKIDYCRNALGFNTSPFDAWMLSRSLKTLSIRMEQHQKNAIAVAEYLQQHPLVKKVYFPGLVDHHNHTIAKEQMTGWSGMVSLELYASFDQTVAFISSMKLFRLAESLGGVESLVDHPASMTHAAIPREEREAVGVTDGLVRLSVGIEDTQDLLVDLSLGLKKVES